MSFFYPKNVVIDKNIQQENFDFNVTCANNEGSIGVRWWRSTKYTPKDMLDDMVAYLTDVKITTEYYNDKFGNIPCVSFDFVDEKLYAKIQSFILNGNTVLVIKYNIAKENLDTEFRIIENSLNIEIPE